MFHFTLNKKVPKKIAHCSKSDFEFKITVKSWTLYPRVYLIVSEIFWFRISDHFMVTKVLTMTLISYTENKNKLVRSI